MGSQISSERLLKFEGLEPCLFAFLGGAPRLGMKNLFVGCVRSECNRISPPHILRPDVSPLGFIHVKPVGSQISSERLLKFEGLEPVTNPSCTGFLRLGMKNLFVGCVRSECFCNSTAHILHTDVSPLGFIHGKVVALQFICQRVQPVNTNPLS